MSDRESEIRRIFQIPEDAKLESPFHKALRDYERLQKEYLMDSVKKWIAKASG